MNKINWTAVAVFAIVALLVFVIAGSLLGGWGMMGPGMMGRGGFGPFAWVGMIFMWLIPIGFLVLIVLGIAWLVRAAGRGNNPSASTRTCPSCGRGVQADWRNCPYCGTTLASQ